MGPKARKAISALIQALKNENWVMPQGAAQALGKIGIQIKQKNPKSKRLSEIINAFKKQLRLESKDHTSAIILKFLKKLT